jgi:hypothetical protein
MYASLVDAQLGIVYTAKVILALFCKCLGQVINILVCPYAHFEDTATLVLSNIELNPNFFRHVVVVPFLCNIKVLQGWPEVKNLLSFHSG